MTRLLIAILFISSLAMAQEGRYDSPGVNTTANIGGVPGVLTVVLNASVRICTYSLNPGIPCSPLATTFTDATGVTSCPGISQVVLAGTNTCTATTDSIGNFGFWAPPGQYTCQVTASGVVTTNQICSTINNTFTGVVVSCSSQGAFYVGGSCASFWGNGDIGSQVNTACASLPSTGGRIHILAQSSAYLFSTTMAACATNNKPVMVEGDPGGTVLTYTGAGTAITLDWGANHHPGGGMQDIKLACSSASGTTGVLLGGTNGQDLGFYKNVQITGCGTGLTTSTAGGGVFLATFVHMTIGPGNTTGVNWTTNAEGVHWYGGAMFQNATALTGPPSGGGIFISSMDFDDNTASPAISWTSGTFQCDDCWFENFNLGAAQYLTATGGTVKLIGGNITDDRTTSTNPQFMTLTNTHLIVDGTTANSLGITVTNAFNLTGNSFASIDTHNFNPTKVTNDFNTAFAPATGTIWYIPQRGDCATCTAWLTNTHLNFNNTTQPWIITPSNGGNAYTWNYQSPAGARTVQVNDPQANTALELVMNTTTGSIGGSAVGAGACTVTTGVTVTGALAGERCTTVPNTYPGDSFEWSCYVASANSVTHRVCNRSTASATPTSSTYAVTVFTQ